MRKKRVFIKKNNVLTNLWDIIVPIGSRVIIIQLSTIGSSGSLRREREFDCWHNWVIKQIQRFCLWLSAVLEIFSKNRIYMALYELELWHAEQSEHWHPGTNRGRYPLPAHPRSLWRISIVTNSNTSRVAILPLARWLSRMSSVDPGYKDAILGAPLEKNCKLFKAFCRKRMSFKIYFYGRTCLS